MRTSRKLFSLLLAFSLVLSLIYVPSAYATTSSSSKTIYRQFPTLTVNVEIEVEGISLAEASGVQYQISRSKYFLDYGKYYGGTDYNTDKALLPQFATADKKAFTAQYKNGKLVLLDNKGYAPTFTGTSTNSYLQTENYYSIFEDLLWFEPAAGTDSHYSIEGIEIVSGASTYTYDGGTRASNTMAVQAYNCVKPNYTTSPRSGYSNYTNAPANHTVNLRLRLRYNPGIDEREQPEPPQPEYAKTITPYENKENTYRLALTLDTPEPAEKEAEKDVIFVLDTSSSMTNAAGGITRIQALRNALTSTIDKLAENETTRMHIVLFGTNATTILSNANPSADSLYIKQNYVNGINAGDSRTGPGTNYYDALTKAQGIVGNVPSSRESIVFFITDGAPTAAKPAMEMTTAYNVAYYPAAIYARQAAQNLHPDRFYGIFVGDSEGSASELQAVTQKIQLKQSKNSEKFMIKATNDVEFNRAMERFVAFLDNSFYNVVIKDQISEYLDYAGNAMVTAKQTDENGRVTEKTLVAGTDYKLNISGRNVTMELLKNATASTVYTLSFDVSANEKGLQYFYDRMDSNGDGIVDAPETIYPNVGDPDTGESSSGQYGLHSNVRATLQYSYGGSKTFTADYPHPVFQIEPNVAEPEIRLRKVLLGKSLEEGEFSFQLYDEHGNAVGAPVTNDASGEIIFNDLSIAIPGRYKFTAKEIIPADPNPAITYDERELSIVVDISLNNLTKKLEANASYPNGAIFTNEYQPEPVEVTLEAIKFLKGDLALEAGMFQFILEGRDENGRREVIETVSNEQPEAGSGNRGKIRFSPLVFDKVGEYSYTITEDIPIPRNKSIRYDYLPIQVKIKVEEANGKLEANVTYVNDRTTFTNKYTPPVEANIEIPVILTGRRLEKDMFNYELKLYDEENDKVGELVAESGNDTDGKVRFVIKDLKEETQLTYIATQIKPKDDDDELFIPHMTYDEETKIIVRVTVAMDEDENLKATVDSYEVKGKPKAKVQFYNIYNVLGDIW